MSFAATIAIVLLVNALVALAYFTAAIVHKGGSIELIWILWFALVAGISAGAFWLHAKSGERGLSPKNTSNEQNAGAQDAPISPPRNATNSADTEQVNRQSANGGAAGEGNGYGSKINWPIILNLAFAGTVAAATICLAIFGGRQLNAISRQIEIAESTVEQMRLEQRAWLGMSNPEIGKFVAGERPVITIPIRNSGNTPAIMEHAGIVAIVVDSKAETNIGQAIKTLASLIRKQTRENAVPPEGVSNFKILDAPVLEQSDIDEITKIGGKRKLWILGVIDYRDIMKANRTTICCYYYDPITKGPMGYEKYNYMD